MRTAAQAEAASARGGSWEPSPGSNPAALAARLAGVSLKKGGGGSGGGNGGNGGNGGKSSRPTAQVSANTVDVRGEYAEPAIDAVESALARANQYGALYIIHGHGTGRLREAIRAALKPHPFVLRLEDAAESQGGRGCTVAFLRD